MNKITHNMHGKERVCSRCGRTPTITRVKSEYLCQLCKEKRAARQRRSANYVHNTCECGTRISADDVRCDTCDEQQDTINQLVACKTLKELKDFIAEHLLNAQ